MGYRHRRAFDSRSALLILLRLDNFLGSLSSLRGRRDTGKDATFRGRVKPDRKHYEGSPRKGKCSSESEMAPLCEYTDQQSRQEKHGDSTNIPKKEVAS